MIIEATCSECNGDGYIYKLVPDTSHNYKEYECDTCHGEGIVEVYEKQE